ncbi:MAG: DUF4906 domain-containing protein [Bacteroides sp.]|nr:DUF4906 domain-containing protein [Bacteroides sp.]
MKQNHRFIIGLFLFLSFAGACTDEQEGISLGQEEVQGITVNLALSSLPLQGSGTVTRSVGTGMDLVLGDDADASTRIVDDSKESDVNDICIFQFEGDSKGSSSAVLISKTYVSALKSATPVTTLPLVLSPFTKYFLYVCANVGDITGEYNVGEAASNYTVGASTFQDMLDGSFKVNAQSDFGEALPMSGCSDLIETSAVPDKIGITLTRMVAKVTFICHLDRLPSGDKFENIGAKLCNVPQKAMYEQPLDNTSTVEVTSHVGTVSMDETGKIATCVWYMPENKRGIKDGITSWAERVEKNAPKYSSFIELSGNYTRSDATTATEVAYSIYLGNGVSNYDVERNHRYQFTSTIKGVNTADRRVTTDTNLSADGLANCYLAGEDNHWYRFNGTVRGNGNTVDYAALQYPGQGVSLFPSPVTGAPDAVTIPIGQVANAVVVWETAAGLISELNWDSSSGYVRFKTGTAKGNALIAVRNAGGDILWSWHIWRTNGVDLATLNTEYALNIQTNTDRSWYKALGVGVAARKRNLTILDRNIGANFSGKTVTIGDNMGVYGLQYEFGRKDPFPAGNAYSSGFHYAADGDVTLYGYMTGDKKSFTVLSKVEAANAGHTNTAAAALDYIIKHPEVLFKNDNTSTYNWFVNATSGSNDWKVSNCLWGDNNLLKDEVTGDYIYVDSDPWDGEKTIYDPAPAGWRVAPADTWTGIVKNDTKWGENIS